MNLIVDKARRDNALSLAGRMFGMKTLELPNREIHGFVAHYSGAMNIDDVVDLLDARRMLLREGGTVPLFLAADSTKLQYATLLTRELPRVVRCNFIEATQKEKHDQFTKYLGLVKSLSGVNRAKYEHKNAPFG